MAYKSYIKKHHSINLKVLTLANERIIHHDNGTDPMSLVVRKPAFRIYENKDADQLRGDRETYRRLCFRYTDSTIPLIPKTEISIFCDYTARFVSDLLGNPEDRFSHNEAPMVCQT